MKEGGREQRAESRGDSGVVSKFLRGAVFEPGLEGWGGFGQMEERVRGIPGRGNQVKRGQQED